MSQPISPALLVHSATLYSRTGDDDYGNPAWSATAVSLTRVRLTRAKQTIAGALGEASKDRLVLIFDCTNSLPVGTTFKARDKIVYGGETFLVRDVYDPSGDSTAAHHYRVALVGA